MVDLLSNWNIIHRLKSWKQHYFSLSFAILWLLLKKTAENLDATCSANGSLKKQSNSSYGSAGSKKQGSTDEINSLLSSRDVPPAFLTRRVSEHFMGCSWSRSFQLLKLKFVIHSKRMRFHPLVSFDMQFLVYVRSTDEPLCWVFCNKFWSVVSGLRLCCIGCCM